METKELLEQLVKEVETLNRLIALEMLHNHGDICYHEKMTIQENTYVKERVNNLLAWLKR